ncbi:phospholipase D family protein [Sphingomonas sp. PB4P5]|uniref:phospholipase D family protein n=1 Tax=Parasphingomonas puruogangriensis TaxID=3096155 RepID=UPI002FC802FE
MIKFLTGGDLATAIKEVLSGADVRCAVAYWGAGIDQAFPPSEGPPAARIICDVTRGGTSPKALVDLGATKNKLLRHVPDLHAKVYISDRGAVVGSANASSNGIGFDTGPGLIEAGMLLAPADTGFAEAGAWFALLWKRSKKVDKEALALARKRFRPSGVPGGRPIRVGSLLDQIAADPDRFSEISIVLAQTDAKPKQRARARSAMVAAHPDEEREITCLPDDGMFIGWDRSDLARWRRSCIEFWMPDNRLYCYGRTALYYHDATGTVMTRKYWPAVRSVVEGDLPDPKAICKADQHLVRRLLDKYDDVLFTARELAVAIDCLD